MASHEWTEPLPDAEGRTAQHLTCVRCKLRTQRFVVLLRSDDSLEIRCASCAVGVLLLVEWSARESLPITGPSS